MLLHITIMVILTFVPGTNETAIECFAIEGTHPRVFVKDERGDVVRVSTPDANPYREEIQYCSSRLGVPLN